MILMGQTTARHPDLFLFILGMATFLLVLANYKRWIKAFDAYLFRRLGGV